MTGPHLIIGDIGGTNARFALANPGAPGFSQAITLQCADFENVGDALRQYLGELNIPRPDAVCLAVAGPIIDQQVQMTNNAWRISVPELKEQYPGCEIELINDFTAIALSLPFISADEYQDLGPKSTPIPENQDLSLGVVGPGTGLGVSGLFKREGQFEALISEAGHTGFAPETAEQMEILATLRGRWPRVSAERLCSGAGLENIYWAITRDKKDSDRYLDAPRIFEGAMETGSVAHQAAMTFFEILGQFAGDVSLSLGIENGIYIAGGIVKRYPQLLAQSRFREAFESKGRLSTLVKKVPTRLILHPNPGLLGASYHILSLHRNRTDR